MSRPFRALYLKTVIPVGDFEQTDQIQYSNEDFFSSQGMEKEESKTLRLCHATLTGICSLSSKTPHDKAVRFKFRFALAQSEQTTNMKSETLLLL